MAITKAQQAKQLLNKYAPKGERLAYINSREAKLLKSLGGVGKDINGTGIKSYEYEHDGANVSSSGGPTNDDYSSQDNEERQARDQAAYDAGQRSQSYSDMYDSQAETVRQEEIKKQDIQDAINNPFNKTFVDRGYVPPSTFDPSKAVSKDYIPPEEEEEENKFTKALGKTIDIGKNVGKDLLTTTLTAPYLGPASFAVGPMVRAAKEDKARRDAIDAQISNARLSGSFYTGPVNPTRTTRPDITPDGDNEFPLIQAPFMIQPSREVIEEEPTPYDFDLYAARDNRVARRFAQGGRTGFNMGGMEEENLQAGAPDLRLEGSQIPQQEEMASAPGIDAELYQLFLDALRKGDVPQGTTFDAYKQLMMQMMSEQQGGQMQQPQMAQQQMPPEMMQEQEMQPQRETAAFGGIMGLDGRRSYGWGSIGNIFKKAARAVKKVAKSPIGKAALIYAGGSYLSGAGLFGSLKGAGALSSFVPSFGPKSSIAKFMLKDPKSGFSLANLLGKGLSNKGVFAGITGLSALAGLYTKKTEDDEESLDDLIGRSVRGPSLDPSGIRKQIAANKGNIDPNEYAFLQSNYYAADGGRINKAEGGLMDLGGNEMDLRAEGGFVPIGGKEKADDVPARLSKNEFVFTADAVKGAGQGDIDKGSEVMYNIMKNLEAGGNISEESQGSNGAREMFQTSQRLGEVV